MTRRAPRAADSLLHLRLVEHMVTDQRVRLLPRAIDVAWAWEEVIDRRACGFNPVESAVYFGQDSAFARWLADPDASPRPLNRSDRLLQEVWTAVHDYLHCWAYLKIDELRPDLQLGCRPISAANLDDLVFWHLVTEAVAVVGLDYWFLATFDLNAICPIGAIHQRFAVAYHEQHIAEYRRFNPELEVQTPAFFETLVGFYCTGRMPGFAREDLDQSPLLERWIGKELAYNRVQREIARRWLAHLGGLPAPASQASLRAPIAFDQGDRIELCRALGAALWAKVKHGHDPLATNRLDPDRVWRSPRQAAPDYRFDNLRVRNDLPDDSGAESLRYYWYQYLSGFSFAGFDPALRPMLLAVTRGQVDPRAVHQLCERQPRLATTSHEPQNLLLLN